MATDQMLAVKTREAGGSDVLYIGHEPKPTCSDDGLLVKVAATALNRADILQREGRYPPPAGESQIIGLEISGVVEEVGSSVSNFSVGDRVCALLPGGGYAQYVAIPANMAIPVPEGMSLEDAAAIPEAWLTAFQAVVWHANLQEGESILIHAAGSGVGTAATQLAKVIGASSIVCTAGAQSKLELAESLGATATINYKETFPFSDEVKAATNGDGANVIIDFIGQNYWNVNLDSISLEGRMVMLAFLSGAVVPENAQLANILRKRVTVIGSTLRTRSPEYKARLTDEFGTRFMPLFGSGELKTIVDSKFSVNEVAAAHDYMEANKNLGKIIMTLDDIAASE